MDYINMKGAAVAAAMKGPLADRAAALAASRLTRTIQRKSYAPPKLAIVRVGERPDDAAYERNAIKRCTGVGIECDLHKFDERVTNDAFLREFERINADESVNGVLVLSPLPDSIDGAAVAAVIDPTKDVDCLSPVNLAKIYAGDASGFAPCTPLAVMEILKHYGVPVSGSRVTLVGRSPVVGRPLAMLLLAAHATLTICHTRTRDLAAECRRADILIAAAGRAGVVGGACIKPGAAVVDVGINMGADGALCGDVDYPAAVAAGAAMITPVPGGVGAVTTAILARNVLDACERQRRRML